MSPAYLFVSFIECQVHFVQIVEMAGCPNMVVGHQTIARPLVRCS